jgi:hypothetical protein
VDLSIVVVSLSRAEVLARCLPPLLAQAAGAGAEVWLVRQPSDDPAVAALRRDHPQVSWLDAAPGDNVPRMRAAAMRLARGRVVALLEDDCTVAEGWCHGVQAAHLEDPPVVGGPIEPDSYPRALDWAVFLCEYARFLPPLQGEVLALPGNNVSYRRSLVLRWLEEHGDDGFREAFAHEDWRGQGMPLLADPGMRVRNVNRWTVDTATRSAYHHGRAFAGQRFRGRPSRRLLYAAGSALLPVLKTARVAGEVLSRGRGAGSLLRALPWIIVFHTSWACGEWMGYLFGPGASADRWQ